MQFLAEADRFTSQAEVVKKQGTEELKITANGNNAASQAHAKLAKATTSAERPTFFYSVTRMPVTRKDGSEYIRLYAHANAFSMHNGLRPGETLDGTPNEVGRYGSAEGKEGFGANHVIEAALAEVDGVTAEITAYRQSLASSVGL
jgi:hypothetical protein